MKRKIVISALVIILVCINWLSKGMAQQTPTPEQIKIYQELMKKNKAGQATSGTKKYSTPVIFYDDEKAGQDSLFEKYLDENSECSKYPSNVDLESNLTDVIEEKSDEQLILPDSREPTYFGHDFFDSPEIGEINHTSVPDDYLLGPGDNIIIHLWGRVQQEWNLTVDRQGKIFIPKVGELAAWGMTINDFEKQLDGGLSKVYTGYKFKITLGKIRTIKVFVYGEVKKPGGHSISALSTLFNAIHKGGGPTKNGSLRQIKLIRDKNTSIIDLYDFLISGDKSCDAALSSGDVIFVPLCGPQVTIRGEVKRPAIYELVNNEQVSDLVSLAGGPTAYAFMERLMLDRVSENDSRKIIDIDLSDEKTADLVLADGDDLSVFSIYKMRQNLVWVTGMVKHPGTYERFDSMYVSDLLSKSQLLPNNVYLDRADLYRHASDGQRELVSIDLKNILKKKNGHDILLSNLDSLHIYNSEHVGRKKYIYIDGMVEKPGRYLLYKNMTVNDLIFQAGNLKESAYTLDAELARLDSMGNTNIIDIHINNASHQHFRLMENDHMFIRKTPGYQLHRNIAIDGEVKFPGVYTLTEKNETMWQMLQRAGGFTEKAFPIGTVCTRPAIVEDLYRKDINGILSSSQPLVVDSSGMVRQQDIISLNPESMDRIILDMELLLLTNGVKGDFQLHAGDSIYVPETPTGISVLGEVCANGTIKYEGKKQVKDYLKKAGGFTKRADKGETRLIKANGRVYASNGVMKKKVELGDIIVVPAEIKKDRDWFKFVSTSLSILTGVATTILIVDRL